MSTNNQKQKKKSSSFLVQGGILAAAGILAWVLVKKKPARESLYVNRKREEPQADEKQAD